MRRLKCTAMSGNPLPDLEWFAGNKKVETSRIKKVDSGAFVQSEISVKVDRSDNGKVFQCRAKSEATEKPLVKSVSMKVSFPPTKVNIVSEPKSSLVGSKATLKCQTDSSFPNTDIIWWQNSKQILGSESRIERGEFGGNLSSSFLEVEVTVDHIDSLFMCEARQQGATKVSNTTKVPVQCK